MLKEIVENQLVVDDFINEQMDEIRKTVGDGIAINALSGGVDSSVVAVLAFRALGSRLKNYFVQNGLMRLGEEEEIVGIFQNLGIPIEVVQAEELFLDALKGVDDPEEKREAITQTFYRQVFADLIKKSGAKHLMQGTILTDIDETNAGIKRQHNVFAQIGIDPKDAFGYHIIEPLVQLRKNTVRIVAQALGLPKSIYQRSPFPGPGLATRVIGPVTREKIDQVRQATIITEAVLKDYPHFQSMTILHQDRVTGVVENERRFGRVIQIRCWDSRDARTATPTDLPWAVLHELGEKIPSQVPGITQVTLNLTPKPPVTMEAL